LEWIRNWVTLLRLGRRRFRSDEDYRRFQAYQGCLILRYFEKRGIKVQEHRVLDLGCGSGGYSQVLRAAGAQVLSVDKQFPRSILCPFVLADGQALPFMAKSFSLVFCASLIEHIPRPMALLKEIRRVLVPGGLSYLSFPPFYSPLGGHQFKPYHLLGEGLAIRLSGFNCQGFSTCFGDWGLYPLTIREVKRMVQVVNFSIEDISVRFLPLNVARIPVLGEFLTWHVQFLLRKSI
jgi:SAM-dependent methyltransferase